MWQALIIFISVEGCRSKSPSLQSIRLSTTISASTEKKINQITQLQTIGRDKGHLLLTLANALSWKKGYI
jgi:hypothetical protein